MPRYLRSERYHKKQRGERRGSPGRPSVAPSKEALRHYFSQSGMESVLKGSRFLDNLWTYHELLREHNKTRDLTRLVGFEAIVLKHYIDCLIVGDFVRLPSPLLDIGTGAGFPGLLLKLRYPKIEVVLAEPRKQRILFLQKVISLLGLEGIEVFPHKVSSRSFERKMNGVITRALEPMVKTMLRSQAAVNSGTRFIFMKGPNLGTEVSDVAKQFPCYQMLQNKTYTLPGTSHERRLVIWEVK